MATLLFFDQGHRYELDGVELPSVTQLTDIFGTYNETLELVMEAAAERGSVLHGYLEHRLQGGMREDYELPGEWESYADAVELFLSEHRLEPMLVETPMWGEAESGQPFAGTPDYVGGFDDVLAVLDWKFVSQIQKTKVGAQLGGYLDLCRYNGIYPERTACVQFLPDGTYRLYPAGEAGKTDFALCLSVYQETNKKHPRGGIA